MVKRQSPYRKRSLWQLAFVLLVTLLLNVVFTFRFTRIDLTQDKRFTISRATRELLKDLDDQVYVTIFLAGNLPAEYRRLQKAVTEMLDEYSAYSGNRISYELFDPFSLDDPDQVNALIKDLMSKGLETRQIATQSLEEFSQKILIAGAVLNYREKELAVNFLPEKRQLGEDPVETVNHGIATLEYTLSNAIRKLMLTRKQKIAFIQGHGELSPARLADIAVTLQDEQYELEFLDLPHRIAIPSSVDLAIIAKPIQKFSEKDKFKIDQYVMNGGRVLWLIDPLYADIDSLLGYEGKPFVLTMDYPLNLEDQLFQYGVRLNRDLVQDERCAGIPLYRGNSSSPAFYPWFFYPIVLPPANHPITKHVGPLWFNFASSIDTIGTPGLKKTILLTTSGSARLMYHPIRITLSMAGTKPDPVLFNKSNIPLAVLVEGTFRSVFRNRVPHDFLAIYRDSLNLEFRESSPPNRMIFIADGDLIANPLGYYRYNPNYLYANKDFILNCIDYLVDNYGLVATRNKEFRVRPLQADKVKSERFKWQLINLLGPILILLVFAGIQSIIRRKKYTGTL